MPAVQVTPIPVDATDSDTDGTAGSAVEGALDNERAPKTSSVSVTAIPDDEPAEVEASEEDTSTQSIAAVQADSAVHADSAVEPVQADGPVRADDAAPSDPADQARAADDTSTTALTVVEAKSR